MVIFQGFRRFLEVITALTSALEQLATIQRNLGPALERLEVLERGRHHFEAECQGLLLKAEGRVKAANSSEQRERQIKKANDKLVDFGDLESEEATPHGTYVLSDDGKGSAAPRLPALPLVLARNDKAHAVRAKFGV